MNASAQIVSDGFVRGFHWSSQAWYRAATLELHGAVDSMMIGVYDGGGGGTRGEFRIEWHKEGESLSPRVIVFNDAWRSLHAFSDLLEKLATLNGKNVHPQEMAELLQSLGVADLTERVRTA